MCDSESPLVSGETDAEASARKKGEAAHSSGCKNPNCPNRHRCSAADQLAPASSSSEEEREME